MHSSGDRLARYWNHLLGPSDRHGGDRASYTHELDMTHWTTHPAHLARDFGRKQSGDEGYEQEELVAELGTAFLCAELELATELRGENASYIVPMKVHR